ncbi:MAG: amidohydrolase [Bacteroidetes bacterium]|nr:amidohydrolase [Bacteroidota bacterium]
MLKVSIVQTALFWEEREKNLSALSNQLQNISNSDLIILPEMFSSGFTMNAAAVAEDMRGESVTWMKKIAKEKNCTICGSLVIKENSGFYNRLVVVDENENIHYYDKKHLFRMSEENNVYTPGNKPLTIRIKGWNVRFFVCYDLRFPIWCRNKFTTDTKSIESIEYDLAVFVANWPERRSIAWKTLLQARAIENHCYVVGVNRIGSDGNNIPYSGDSAVLNFLGERVSNTKPHENSVETVELSREKLTEYRTNFPVWMDADSFTLSN